MKWRKISAVLLSAAMVVTLGACSSSSDSGSSDSGEGSGDKYRVCFVARASADTFAAWMTTEMQAAAEQYDDIELTCVSGEGDDNTENGLLETVSHRNMILLLFSPTTMQHRLRM